MLDTWEEFDNFPPQDEEGIRREVIWFNCHIATSRNPFTRVGWQRWITAGIMTINDIYLPEHGRLMGQLEIEEKYHMKTNFLENLSLRNSIPFHWKQSLTTEFSGDSRIKYEISVQDKDLGHSQLNTQIMVSTDSAYQETRKQATGKLEARSCAAPREPAADRLGKDFFLSILHFQRDQNAHFSIPDFVQAYNL